MSRIHVTIDRLVFSGLDAAARTAFIRGLKTELIHTLNNVTPRAAQTATLRSRRIPVLRLGKVALNPGAAGARSLGAQVARGIAGRIDP